MDRYDITIQMLGVEASGPQYVWEKVPAEEGELVLYTDAQATIAALQARVKELEQAAKETHGRFISEQAAKKDVIDELTVALKSDADGQVLIDKLMQDVLKLESQLTQRTAELEAANKHCEIIEERKAEAYKEVEIQLLAKADLQAELERVRGELAETKEEVKCLDEQVSALNQGCLEYERLIVALPKVEGEIRVIEVATDEWHVYDTIFATKAGADNYAALLQHRQGMEG